MNTDTTCLIESSSSSDTFAIGERFGKRCRGGEVFLLISDLGGGKTTFTKGLASGLGSDETVSSPTFTVSRVYKARDGMAIYHFDFYRLDDGGVVAMELAEVINDPRAIAVIEWGDIVSEVLPKRRIEIKFERVADEDDARRLHISSPAELAYVYKEEVVKE